MAFVAGLPYLGERHSSGGERLLGLDRVGLCHLYHHAGVLGEKNLHDVVFLYTVQTDLHTALGVGERHLQQSGDEAAGADVVSRQYQAVADQSLHSVEGFAEISGVLDGRNVAAHLVKTLRKGTASQTQCVGREVYVVECGRHVARHGVCHLAYVLHLSTAGDDDGTRGDDLLAVGVLLRHAQRVFAGRHVDVKGAAEVAQRLHRRVQTCVFAFLCTARPHPVGAEAYTVQSLLQRSPHDVGERLGHAEYRPVGRVCQSGLRSVSQSRGYTFLSAVVESHHAAVGKRKLQLSLALLASHLSGYAAVHLVGEPVLAGHGLQLEHHRRLLA